MKITKFSPCKINLMLAITGVREDGFHNLLSLVAPTKFGDTLEVELLEPTATADKLFCELEGVPCDDSNLVMKAAKLFRAASKLDVYFNFKLTKLTPAGAGLGGGSSNGAVALLAMNELCKNPLSDVEELAAELGSDCPLFLTGTPVVMRGRGELVFPLGIDAAECISRLKLLLFKPAFSINTAWAYTQMKANPTDYIDAEEAESKLSVWLENPSIDDIPLINNMQIEAFKKYPALEVALEEIRENFKIPAMMSGSGSACFAIVNNLDEAAIVRLEQFVKNMLGDSCFIARA